MTGAMHNERPRLFDTEQRLVSLDRSDVEDLRRLLAKLSPWRPVATGTSDVHAENDSEPLVRRARDALEMRRKRIAIFGPQMFAEPAWENAADPLSERRRPKAYSNQPQRIVRRFALHGNAVD